MVATAFEVPTRHAPPAHALGGMRTRLSASVDLASLAVFRILFGLLLLWEVWRHVSKGWVTAYYVDPAFNFTYSGFSWVRPLPAVGMVAVFAVLGVAAVLFTVGAWYRTSAIVLALGHTYVFLLEQARYLNHFYLICVVATLMVFVPAGRMWSVDALAHPSRRAATAPRWWLAALQLQLGVVDTYAGLAKLNGDWLAGEPMRTWLAQRTDVALIGRWFTEDWMVLGMSWGGLLFDLLVVPALLWRRTRVAASLAAVSFHLLNEELFRIGICPWFALAATTLFFRPDWPPPGRTGARGRARRPQRCERGRAARHGSRAGAVRRRAGAGADPATGASRVLDPREELESWRATAMRARPDMIAQFARHLADRAEASGRPRPEVCAQVSASLNGRPSAPLVDPDVDLAAEPAWQVHRDWIPLDDAPPRESAGERAGRAPG